MTARVLGVYGGVNINTQKLLVYEGVDILVGTPGRVMDLMKDAVLNLKDLKNSSLMNLMRCFPLVLEASWKIFLP